MANLTQAALDLSQKWYVFPLQPGAKYPRIKEWQHKAVKGMTEATRFWEEVPNANIGIACGLSNLVIIDLDTKDGKNGIEVWEELKREYGFNDDTVTVLTPSGGMHLYFKAPEGVDLGNGTVGKLGEGIDTRSGNSFVVAPPSVVGGKTYEWELSGHPGDMEPAELPQPIVDLLLKEKRSPAPSLPGEILEGQRHDSLLSLAGSMRRRGASAEAILAALEVENGKRCVPPLPREELETLAKSMMRYEPAPQPVTYRVGQPDPERAPHRTDMGNALRLVRRHGQDLRYCPQLGGWLVWNGRYWETAAHTTVEALAKQTILAMYEELPTIEDQDERTAHAKWVASSESVRRIRNMVTLAASEPGIPAAAEDFDTDTWALNVQNGTVNLKTGELEPHCRDALITQMAPVDFVPHATCPRWEAFLDQIMGGNRELVLFLQRSLGLSMTGYIGEDVLFILYGKGANGKTTFVTVISDILGSYAKATPTSTLMRKRGDSIPNDVARLRGARFVSATEGERGQALAEAFVKQLTGGDKVTARFLHREWFEFVPECKIWLVTNHRPIVKDTTDSIWRRIKLIPFTIQIPEAEQDRDLPQKLLDERAGILQWGIAGCMSWQAEGLKMPQEVTRATRDYRADMDALDGFIRDRCEVGVNLKAQAQPLYDAYKRWCEDGGERYIRRKEFSDALVERGHNKDLVGGLTYYFGLRLKPGPGEYVVGKPPEEAESQEEESQDVTAT